MFSIKESIKYAWKKLGEHAGLVLSATVLTLVTSCLTSGFNNDRYFIMPLLDLVAIVILVIIKIGYAKIFLKIYDGENPKFLEIFEEYRIFWRYLGASILFALVFVGGLILLIIPGIFWAVRFYFSTLIVIDTKIGPIAAMKESYAITKGSFWKILLFLALIALFNLVGLILFGVGLLITIPLSTFASVYVYRELSKAKAGVLENASPQVA